MRNPNLTTPRRQATSLIITLMLALIAAQVQPRPALAAQIVITTAYTTGYTWYDNSPPGPDICCGVRHSKAGGVGTYEDPISLASGFVSNNVLEYAKGTRFYMTDVRRYFMVEDSCASCIPGDAPGGKNTTHVDMWVGGYGVAGGTQAQVQQGCSWFLTDDNTNNPLHTIVVNPPANWPVVAGPLVQNGQCTAVYGNTVPSGPPPPTQPPAPPPTQPPAPPPTPTPIPPGPVAAVTKPPSGPAGAAQPAAKPIQAQAPPSSPGTGKAAATAAGESPLSLARLAIKPTSDWLFAGVALLIAVACSVAWLLFRRRPRRPMEDT